MRNLLDLLGIMQYCVITMGDIQELLLKKQKTIKYFIRKNIKYIKSYFKRKKIIDNDNEYFLDVLSSQLPSNQLYHEYEKILEKHTNGLRIPVERLDYESQFQLYLELVEFSRQLDAIEILLKSDVITDYSVITTK